MKKKIVVVIVSLLFLVSASEIYLRYYWGFCDDVLYSESDKFEYIAQPNQDRFRLRKHIRYNEYSMRSNELKSGDKVRILGLGDSVINGGTGTDQDSLATSLIEKTLTETYGDGYRCLNIGSNSWGPDNCYAYLQEYGDFDAKLIFLIVSSHDAYDNMTFQKVVGKHLYYPSSQYKFAVSELFGRYLYPHLFMKTGWQDNFIKGDTFNSGFSLLHEYAREKGIPFFIYLHPDKNELLSGKYDVQGYEIIDFCLKNSIPLLKGMEYEKESSFRDVIHINDEGQRILASALLPEIEKLLNLNGKNK
jgi:hypothetical protein